MGWQEEVGGCPSYESLVMKRSCSFIFTAQFYFTLNSNVQHRDTSLFFQFVIFIIDYLAQIYFNTILLQMNLRSQAATPCCSTCSLHMNKCFNSFTDAKNLLCPILAVFQALTRVCVQKAAAFTQLYVSQRSI